MNKAMLIAQGVSKRFIQGKTEISILNTIDIQFVQGETYAITGLSGAGKSTLIHLIAGLDKPTAGAIIFNETPLQTLSNTDLSLFLNKSIGLVFQSPHMLGELSVIENIMLPSMIAGHCKKTCEDQASKLLTKVGLSAKATSKPGELSGGQQQRAAIARALMNKPLFLIADEPTGNLDRIAGKEIIELLISCNKEWGMGVIVSSHDAYVAQAMKNVYELIDGTLKKL